MAASVRPPKLELGHAYVHISSSSSPDTITNAFMSNPHCRLKYMGPVGELKGEHIFEVSHAEGGSAMASAEKPVLDAIKTVVGVNAVKAMDVKPRAKRDEF